MDRIMTSGFFLLLAAGATVAAGVYFENFKAKVGTGGICLGFLVVAAAALLGAVHLHRK